MSEDLQANAVSFLIDGGEFEAAHLLLACSELSLGYMDTVGFEHQVFVANLTGPRAVYDAVMRWQDDSEHDEERYRQLAELRGMKLTEPLPEPAPTTAAVAAILRALNACTAPTEHIERLEAFVEGPGAFPGWRREMAEAASQVVHNQATAHAERVITWANLRFRSQSEVRIAKALSNADVMFLPNCLARLPLGDGGMGNREPDFIVCAEGRWGILEVDGEPWHPAERAAQDHTRDRAFRRMGVRVVERYTANRCYNDPDGVVAEFLGLLRAS